MRYPVVFTIFNENLHVSKFRKLASFELWFKYTNIEDICWLARIAVLAPSPTAPALTDVVGSNPSECKLELASGNTQIKYAMSINRDIDGISRQRMIRQMAY